MRSGLVFRAIWICNRVSPLKWQIKWQGDFLMKNVAFYKNLELSKSSMNEFCGNVKWISLSVYLNVKKPFSFGYFLLSVSQWFLHFSWEWFGFYFQVFLIPYISFLVIMTHICLIVKLNSKLCVFLSCNITRLEWICTLWLPKCQGTPYSKQVQYLKFRWRQPTLAFVNQHPII